jgi:hypothetical protein
MQPRESARPRHPILARSAGPIQPAGGLDGFEEPGRRFARKRYPPSQRFLLTYVYFRASWTYRRHESGTSGPCIGLCRTPT